MSDKKKNDEIELEDEDFEVDETMSESELTNAERIERMVQRQLAETQDYIDEEFEKINTKVDDLTHRVDNLEKIAANIASMKPTPEEKASRVDRFLDATLGTIGRAGHAVVDTVAFVGESIVDVVTLGRARNKKC